MYIDLIMKYRISKSGVSENGNNWILICRNVKDELQIAFIQTTTGHKNGELLEIPDNLLGKINWKIFYPTTKFPHDYESYTEHKDLHLLKILNDSKLLFDQSGKCYYLDNNNCFIGFIYIKNFEVLKYTNKQLPKLHLSIDCNAISNQILFNFFVTEQDKFAFTFTNSLYNDVVDRHSSEIFKNRKLEICNYCKQKLIDDDVIILEWVKHNSLSNFLV